MTADDIREMIAENESDVFEYKATTGQRVEGCRTLCAFLNGKGGTVVFGVTKEGKLTGQLVSDETKKDLASAFYGFQPTIDVKVEYVPVDNAHKAIVCRVEHGAQAPYVYDDKPYRRVESTTTVMPHEMYVEMIRQRLSEKGEPDFSATVCGGLSIEDLSVDAIADFRHRWAKKSGQARINNLTDEQTLRDCGAMRRNGELTYAALVLFGSPAAIREFLPSAECVFEYRAKVASGAADERISYREAFFSFYDKLWDRINVRNTKQHYQDGLFVMDIPLFNERVIREALLNAVAHRNYQMQGYVLIRQYPEILNIESPGGFPYGVTPDTVLECSLPRNRLIAEIFECAGLVERAGQGVNLMFELSVREAKALPDYSRSDGANVRLSINGLLLDPALLRMIQNIEEQTLTQFATEDFLVLHELACGYRPSKMYSDRIPRLVGLGILEKVERGHYVLSRRYYVQKGVPGTHTRRVGLVAEECKALIEKHIRLSGNKGVPIKEFKDLLSGTPARRISYFLDQLKKTGKLRAEGKGRGAFWFLIEQKDRE